MILLIERVIKVNYSKFVSMTLTEIIICKIKKDGPISFHDFMEIALYFPHLGYYTNDKVKIGASGDYYTSPALSHLFGAMLGKQLEEMWRLSGEENFDIVEYGGGNGSLCKHILTYLQKDKKLFDHLTYTIIEKKQYAPEQKDDEIFSAKIKYVHSSIDLKPIKGCIIANEFIDNLPVHVVVMQDQLMEVFLDYDNNFAEILLPASDELKNYFSDQNISLPKGYRTELNLHATEWIKEVAAVLSKGFCITIDYGFAKNELYDAKRNAGTLLCYYHHSRNNNPYMHIGEQDITAHVNFSALYIAGLKYGLAHCGYCGQSYFLRALGINSFIRENENSFREKQFNNDVMKVYTLLTDMGNKIKVLIQSKGIIQNKLTGMQLFQENL